MKLRSRTLLICVFCFVIVANYLLVSQKFSSSFITECNYQGPGFILFHNGLPFGDSFRRITTTNSSATSKPGRHTKLSSSYVIEKSIFGVHHVSTTRKVINIPTEMPSSAYEDCAKGLLCNATTTDKPIPEPVRCETQAGCMADLWAKIDEAYINSNQPGVDEIVHPRLVRRYMDRFKGVLRQQQVMFLNATPSYPNGLYQGAGIVTVAGGLRYFPAAYVTIRLIRRTNCTLPIELWHTVGEQFTPDLRALLNREFQVEARSVDEVAPIVFGGFGLKIAALLFSRFEQIIFVDADNHPVRNPAELLLTKEFLDTGLLLWPDLWYYRPREMEFFWELMGQPQRAHRAVPAYESGQLVVDKRRMWRMLLLVMLWTHQHHLWFYITVPNGAGIGDKELFPLACQVLNIPYNLVEYPPAAAGEYEKAFIPLLYSKENAFHLVPLPLNALAPAPPSAPPLPSRTTPTPASTAPIDGFLFFRFIVSSIRGVVQPQKEMVQVGELVLIGPSGARFPLFASPMVHSVMSTATPAPRAESVRHVFDGNLKTKWLNKSPAPAILFIRYRLPMVVREYWWSTANDEPGRDPVSWSLAGSNDGEHWTMLHSMCNYPTPDERLAMVGPFDVDGSADLECPNVNETNHAAFASSEPPQPPPKLSSSSGPIAEPPTTLLMTTKRVVGHTQVHHTPSGDVIFLHRNCHKIQTSAPSLDEVWEAISFHRQVPGILTKERALVLPDDRSFNRRECRFGLVNASGSVDFRSAIPFDVEALIRNYIDQLMKEPAYVQYRKVRMFRFKEKE